MALAGGSTRTLALALACMCGRVNLACGWLQVVRHARMKIGDVARRGAPTARGATSPTVSVPSMASGGDDESPIFCNRELKLSNVEAIGFDMDYTLAQYFSEFDLLAFDGAVDKLVGMGYPEKVREFSYDPRDYSRGLVIDKVNGNMLKMDRYKYVKIAHHGSRPLSVAERKQLYQERFDQMPSFTGPDFVNVDTLFQLVDAALYAQLVDLKDELAAEPENAEQIEQSYFQLYTDVRHCVDLCHRDGVIKDKVAEDPAKYIMPDQRLFSMLERFRRSGKKVFLLTNSLWDYTTVVMNFLSGNDKEEDRNEDWLEYFDLVITGSCKPAFLQDSYLSLFRVNVDDHTLVNTDGPDAGKVSKYLSEGKVFQGGNWNHLHKMLGLQSGDRLLYVGDHMYSDILRSKRSLGWRTCLVIPELSNEMAAYRRAESDMTEMHRIRDLRNSEDDTADTLRLKLCDDDLEGEEKDFTAEELADAIERRNLLHEELKQRLVEYNKFFHPTWGQLFKAGFMDSRFAKQVADYACLYTTQVSDLGEVSPEREFRAISDSMPHDQLAVAVEPTSAERAQARGDLRRAAGN